jgi:hypothetical protein
MICIWVDKCLDGGMISITCVCIYIYVHSRTGSNICIYIHNRTRKMMCLCCEINPTYLLRTDRAKCEWIIDVCGGYI